MTKTISRVVAILFVVAFAISVDASSAAPHLGIEVGEPQIKVIDGPDDDGDLRISVKVTVKNTTETEMNVELNVQALDRDNFEVFDMFLSDAVRAGQERVLTDTDYIQERTYKSVAKWRVEEVTARGGQPNNTVQPSTAASRGKRGRS